ncbi:hypothetical protein [Paenibacillus xylanilyticus]|uniref:Uncharacterized protein n=1 Tax=Paenibacillus xylanilyticus TaxID=248903 RepID=A0A7Y6ERF5_9BACL|nr:hypothetical protein [Paenibacillus xylanilyticus]NUU73852.1 hypothetical protein [Paenibacillus xylanilyticus]
MKKMYPAVVNSPKTELTDLITESQTDIAVADIGVLLPGEGIATIGNGDAAETILYTSVDGNTLKGCVRGFQGIARAWTSGTRIARNFAAADWDAARENIIELAERVDVPKRSALTLQPGMQTVRAEQDAPFALTGLTGRTLVNLLGRDGNFEDASKWSLASCSLTLDNTSFLYGSSSGKATTTGTNSSGLVRRKTLVPIDNTKYYIAIVEIKNTDATSAYLRVMKPDYSATLKSSTPKTNKGSYLLHYVKLSPADLVGLNSISFDLVFPYVNTGSVINFDGGGVYEVDKALYDRIGVDVTESSIRNYLPYVDSVQPVRNPYAIRYGENLLPPFYDGWQNTPRNDSTGKGTIISPYEYSVVANAEESWIGSPWIPAIPGKSYTLSANHTGQIQLVFTDKDKVAIINSGYSANQSASLIAPDNVAYVVVYFRNTGLAAGTFSIKNPMLTLDTTTKSFKPREDAMIALQTDLFADPLTGANADEVFEKDGQYFKLKKWDHITLDGEKAWVFNVNEAAGVKVVYFLLSVPYNPVTWNPVAVKYDGKILARTASGSDRLNGSSEEPRLIILSISSADSGWGDAYTPTADEIKAYFMGWVMTTQESWSTAPVQYNGTGTKGWVRRWLNASQGNPSTVGSIGTWVDMSATPTVPTTMSAGFTPYQLVYQLATPTVEPITSEGQLTLIEGNNQVEVGTGIVLREATKPVMTKVGSIEYYHFNNTDSGVNNPFKYRVEKILNIYVNGKRASGVVVKNEKEAYGNQDAHIEGKDFIKDGAYTATYLMLDRSPIAPLIGSVPDNEKALLTDLVQDIQQANTRLSVVESKKEEKDAHAWITPTLLNGWVSESTEKIRYIKIGRVCYIEGRVSGGASGNAIQLFTLAEGYRPGQNVTIITRTGQIVITDYGHVLLYQDDNAITNISGTSFVTK